jgi:hypothetical protein
MEQNNATTDDTTQPKDDAQNRIEWMSDGRQITITADRGRLTVTVDGDDLEFEFLSPQFVTHKGDNFLDCGRQRLNDGTKINAQVGIDDRKAELKQLKEDSKRTHSLAYTVEEYTKTTRSDWGNNKVTKQRLSPNKTVREMTDRESELHRRVDRERDVPDDAEPGETFGFEELLDDPRTRDERDQDALDEAAETGEEVVITRSTTDCNDPSKECNVDHVSRVATPDGDITTQRIHTY